ncbi:MAG TPA: N-acetyltransferase [Staphylococcus sp.]|nr:N-acetyltransferase [Staphylococcus sp.]
MQIYLSTLTENDYDTSIEAIQSAFEDETKSTHDEHELVLRLREALEYKYELEVVAKNDDGDVVGHVMLSEAQMVNEEENFTILTLAPLSVLPEYRDKGVGKALVQAVEERAKAQGYTTIIVLGHPEYYKQLGYEEAEQYGMYSPFDVPSENFMVKFLWDQLIEQPSGKVIYPEAFN